MTQWVLGGAYGSFFALLVAIWERLDARHCDVQVVTEFLRRGHHPIHRREE